MGGHCYHYFVPYQENIESALQALRKQEFEAGRYNPAIPFPFDEWPSQAAAVGSGAKHKSIDEAFEGAGMEGTRSILDLEYVDTEPESGVVVQLSLDRLVDLYGTTQPTHTMVKENMDFFEDLDRGRGIYIIVYKDDRPSEIFFAGISCD
jgi:hypothetical protein